MESRAQHASSGHIKVAAVARSRATPAAVFSLLKDSDTWPRWSLFNSSEVERAGDDERFGVGAIRSFSSHLSKSREQVTELVPDQKLGYVLLSGLPLRNYQAVVCLSSLESGVTLVDWTASFQCGYGTGWFWRIFMNLILSKVAMQLAAAAEKSDPSDS
jgi:Polyketide cyclase / dehydrase and lipid transport